MNSLRFKLALAVAAPTALYLSTATTSPTGISHSGGNAVPLVRDFTVAPSAGQGWTANVAIVDLDGGDPIAGVDVSLKGGGLSRLTSMAEAELPGTYRIALPRTKAGELRFALRIRPKPGGTRITDFDYSYQRTLVRGETLHVVGSSPSGPPDSGSDGRVVVAGAGALLTVAVVCSMLAIRSRPPAAAHGR